MDDRGDEVVAAARRCVGARFRVQGRTRDGGPDGATTPIAPDALGAGREESGGQGGAQVSAPAVDRLPGTISIIYFDVARDYQLGLQRARRGVAGVREERVELPAALDAGVAKMLAERRLADRWARGTTARLSVPFDHLALRPGDQLRLPHSDDRWLVRGWSYEDGVVAMAVERVGPPTPPMALSDPGRAMEQSVAPQGETVLHAFELPAMGDALPAMPRIWAAAAGTESGWRGAQLSRSLDGGASWQAEGRLAPGMAVGVVTSPPGGGSPALRDDRNRLDVLLANDGMALEGATDALIHSGANLALVGGELIQYGEAVLIGPRQYRLSRMLRGRWGSEAAIDGHVAGERFLLLDPDLMAPLDLPIERVGGRVALRAGLSGEPIDSGIYLDYPVDGLALRPPSPVFLNAVREADGAIRLRWTRRSRQGWAWLDGIDAPLGKAVERYRVRIEPAGGVAREVETDAPQWRYDAAMQAADAGGPLTALTVRVAQLSALVGAGRAATRNFIIP